MQKKYELKKSDYEEVERLLKVVNSIDILYDKLYKLEISNKKYTKEYEKTIKYLNDTLELETYMYNQILLSIDKTNAIIDYLCNDRMGEGFDESIDNLLMQRKYDKKISRVIVFLKKQTLKDDNEVRKLFREKDFYNNSTQFQRKTTIKEAKKEMKMFEILERETVIKFLRILEEFIKDESYSSLKEQLLKAKYDVSFVYKTIEPEIIFNKFNIYKLLIFDTKLAIDSLNIKEREYRAFRYKYGSSVMYSEQEELLKIFDSDYKDLNIKLTGILRHSYLRASLLFLDKVSVTGFDEEFQDDITNLNHLRMYNSKSIYHIIKAFEKTDEDKKIYQYQIFNKNIIKKFSRNKKEC